MTDTAFFQVDTQLTALLGETYRSSEAAIKELVDNAWDADADHVWVTLPEVVSKEPIVVRDDGLGMAPSVVRTEYLNIASDRRSRSGEKSVKYGRKIKGRKGIGKFAGLAMAEFMIVETRSETKRTIVEIDKKKIREARKDLEQVPLPFLTSACGEHDYGTTVTFARAQPVA